MVVGIAVVVAAAAVAVVVVVAVVAAVVEVAAVAVAAAGADVHLGPLSSDAITRDFRIFQRKRGHRYSLDDLATAHYAVHSQPAAARCLDLGCGIGSVLLMLAWALPAAEFHGIEAQPESVVLARRSAARNGLDGRVQVHRGDLRSDCGKHLSGVFDLVTGTPPYLPVGSALASPDPQRAAARLELRGGIEDYLAAAAVWLAPAGRVVVCSDGRKPERVVAGAASAGLAPLRRIDIHPRSDAEPLFSVWVLARKPDDEDQGVVDRVAASLLHERAYMRDAAGARTPSAAAMRATFGLAAD